MKKKRELGKTSELLEAGCEPRGPLDELKNLIWREFKLSLVFFVVVVSFGLMVNYLTISISLSPLTIRSHGMVVHKENLKFMLQKNPNNVFNINHSPASPDLNPHL